MPAGKRRPRVNLPYLIRDRAYMRQVTGADSATIELATPLQTYSALDHGQFMDGPANDKVVVLDFDLQTGQALPPMKFVPQGIGKSVSCYEIGYSDLGPDSKPEEFETHAFMQISTFATVVKILDFFESADILGRPLRWGFDADKLVIIPQAGKAKNAFYDRHNHNLQFYYHEAKHGHKIYTALSHDIVVHEATHAILDGIAPDLYNAILPESLALHEAIADISAITQTLLNNMVLFSYDALTGGSDKDQFKALTNIAEEFGADIRTSEGRNYLRRMKNDFVLKRQPGVDRDDSVVVKTDDPHQVSQVLSGILYSIMEQRMLITDRYTADIFSTMDKLFVPAARRVARIIFRALEYLPPGEASFIDYGRAFVIAARATYKQPQKEVRWLKQEFVRRGIIDSADELDCVYDGPGIKISKTLARQLVQDNAAALNWVAQHRDIFNIPAGVEYTVLPCILAHKSLGARKQDELFIKVSWDEIETHQLGADFRQQWAIRRGTTLAISLSDKAIYRLTGNTSPALTEQRDRMLAKLHQQKRLFMKSSAADDGAQQQASHILVGEQKGVMRLEGGMRLLHIVSA